MVHTLHAEGCGQAWNECHTVFAEAFVVFYWINSKQLRTSVDLYNRSICNCSHWALWTSGFCLGPHCQRALFKSDLVGVWALSELASWELTHWQWEMFSLGGRRGEALNRGWQIRLKEIITMVGHSGDTCICQNLSLNNYPALVEDILLTLKLISFGRGILVKCSTKNKGQYICGDW